MLAHTEVWDNYWRREIAQGTQEDTATHFIAQLVKRAFEHCASRPLESAIEIGAGPGRASRYLNLDGVRTAVLDYSPEAIQLAERIHRGLATETYLRDIFTLKNDPLPRKYQLAWNAGVLEHFTLTEQTQILESMQTTVENKGFVILLTPYSHSFFYRMGKFILESLGRFPYGKETPVKTLVPILPTAFGLVERERSIGFIILFFNGFKAISLIPGCSKVGHFLHRSLNRMIHLTLTNEKMANKIHRLDQFLSFCFGGYLLLTIVRKK